MDSKHFGISAKMFRNYRHRQTTTDVNTEENMGGKEFQKFVV